MPMWTTRRRPAAVPPRRRNQSARRRGGAITLELIVNLPIWILVLLAIIQFGQLFSNLQELALASRVGANTAANIGTLPTTDAGLSSSVIVTAVENALDASGLDETAAWSLVLEHNDGGTFQLTSDQNTGVTVDLTGDPAFPASGTYVRVTVGMSFTAVAPNLLDFCGLDFSTDTVQQQTTFLYEG